MNSTRQCHIFFGARQQLQSQDQTKTIMSVLLSRYASAPTTTLWPTPRSPSRCARLFPPRARGNNMGKQEQEQDAAAATDALRRAGLRPESLPRHVAVVMDGNTRWARARGQPASDGHAAGGRNLERIVGLSRAWGIRALTAFVCSQENLNRPKAEVESMMGLSEWLISDNVAKLARQGIRLQVIGDSSKQPSSLQRAAMDAAEATRSNSDLHVMLAICYSGRWDMVQACRELAREVLADQLSPDDIDESLLAGKLATSSAAGEEFFCPDLVIRTGGEQRLSNFLLWQSAYSELYFTDTMWPDFGEAEYLQALRSYQNRDRRFGQQRLY